jgi:flagellin-like protein
MIIQKKRSVSPLIATILLIVVAVILVVAVLSFSKDFVGESLEETKSFLTESSSLRGFITSQDVINKHVIIANNSQQDINIIGFRLIVPYDNQFYYVLNHNHFILDNILISSKNTNNIYLHCLPANNFGLDLLLENNTFVKVNVNVKNYTDDLCSVYKTPITNGLIFRENFENEKNISIVGGVLTNVVLEDETGYFNGSSSRINYGNRFNFNNGIFSIRVVTKGSTDNIGSYRGVISKDAGPSGERSFLLQLDDTTGNFSFDVWQSNGGRIAAHSGVSVDDEIHDVVGVADGSKIRIYVDGVEKSNVNYDGTFFVSEVPFFIGKYSNSYYKGIFYIVEIYDKALSQEEISLLYNNYSNN